MLTFNLLLRSAGIDPARVQMVRHQDARSQRSSSPYMLLQSNVSALELYQSIQSREHFDLGGLVASFVGTPAGDTLFFGLYEVRSLGVAPEGMTDPVGGHSVSGLHLYDLQPHAILSEYRGKLFVDWGQGFRTWVQRARTEKPIIEIRRVASSPPFPGFRSFIWNVAEIELIPDTWKEVLRSVKGIYVLTCMETGKLYVGSAKGVESLYGRFLQYAADGHGGNVQLKKRKKRNYQVSVLEIRNSDDGIEAAENVWMEKLLTRKHGLNGAGHPDSLARLAALFRIFSSPDFRAGIWVEPAAHHGVAQMPFYNYSETVMAFIQDAYEHGWVINNFDWGSWKDGDEARQLLEPEALTRATPQQLYQLLTTVLRSDRFVDGALAEAFESGLILRIVKRAHDIVHGDG